MEGTGAKAASRTRGRSANPDKVSVIYAGIASCAA